MNWEEKYLQQLYKSCPVQQEYHLLAVLDTSKGVHIRNLRAALTCRTLAEDIYADGRRAQIYLWNTGNATKESLLAERELTEWIPEAIWIDPEELREKEEWQQIEENIFPETISEQLPSREAAIREKCILLNLLQIHLESIEKTPDYNKSQSRTEADMMKKYFHQQPPVLLTNEAVLMKGLSEPSMVRTFPLNELTAVYEQRLILSIYRKTDPAKSFDIPLDEGILKQYFDSDKNNSSHPVPFGILVQFGSLVDFQVKEMKEILAILDIKQPYSTWKNRFIKAKYWVEHYGTDARLALAERRDWFIFEALDRQEKEMIQKLFLTLTKEVHTIQTLQEKLYAIPKEVYGPEVENPKRIQGRFFRIIYQLLLRKERGPKLLLLLIGISPDIYLPLLDFSAPATEEEAEELLKKQKQALALQQSHSCETSAANEQADGTSLIENAPAWIPEPVKPEITTDDFQQMDFRVCEIKECTEIPKSHSNLRLVLNDGLKERIIISSIKQEYKPESLIGKKIVVVANLQPAKFTGVRSEGMLLAATHDDCGCKILFVDSSVPAGTRIS